LPVIYPVFVLSMTFLLSPMTCSTAG
jgi:hypothetical protein